METTLQKVEQEKCPQNLPTVPTLHIGQNWITCPFLTNLVTGVGLLWLAQRKSPWTEEPGGLQSMGSLELDMTERLHFHFFTFMHWRRKWQPTPVFLPGESQGWGSPVGCRLWGRTESDTTEVT